MPATENPHQLVLVRVLPVPRAHVFRAWSDPAIMARWFFAQVGWRTIVTADFRIGGAYTLEMFDGDMSMISVHGTYQEIAPVDRLAFTWNSAAVQGTLVTIALREVPGATELTLTHTLFPSEAQAQNHSGGWDGCLDSLAQYLSTNSTKQP